MKLTLVLFDGVTALDVIGGYEPLARLPGIEVELAAARELLARKPPFESV